MEARFEDRDDNHTRQSVGDRSPGSVDPTLQTGTGFNNVVNSLSLQPTEPAGGGMFTAVNQYRSITWRG